MSGPEMLSIMAAESKLNVTISDDFTLETYLCYSNINQTYKGIHSLLHQKQSESACVTGL